MGSITSAFTLFAAASGLAHPVSAQEPVLPFKKSPLAQTYPRCSESNNDVPAGYKPADRYDFSQMKQALHVALGREFDQKIQNPAFYAQVRKSSTSLAPDFDEKERFYLSQGEKMRADGARFIDSFFKFEGECGSDSFRCRQNFFAEISQIVPIAEWNYQVLKGTPEHAPGLRASTNVSSLGAALFLAMNPSASLFCGSSTAASWSHSTEILPLERPASAQSRKKRVVALNPCEVREHFEIPMNSYFTPGKSVLTDNQRRAFDHQFRDRLRQFDAGKAASTGSGSGTQRLLGCAVSGSASHAYDSSRYKARALGKRASLEFAEKRFSVVAHRAKEVMAQAAMTSPGPQSSEDGYANRFVLAETKPREPLVKVVGPEFDPAKDSFSDVKFTSLDSVTIICETARRNQCDQAAPSVSQRQDSAKPEMKVGSSERNSGNAPVTRAEAGSGTRAKGLKGSE
ncbi:MAG: hypothetical protein H7222_05305 [Methylotenera sp.]|nr:hypothetical protein [Oligoflexia bacterium]